MNTKFHKSLNRMAVFATLIIIGLIFFAREFAGVAMANIYLNGAIIGVTLFGAIMCFVDVFRLIPEYNWMRKFFGGAAKSTDMPPRLLTPVATMLKRARGQSKNYISAQTLNNFLDIIAGRLDDDREQSRYIVNVLIFMGLLGTFWGLITTVGGFSDLIGALDFANDDVMGAMQAGLARPLSGIGTAFSSSLLGLGGSLIVGFLSLQATLAQNALFRELEENLSDRAKLFGYLGAGARGEETMLPYVNAAANDLARAARDIVRAVERLEKTIAKKS